MRMMLADPTGTIVSECAMKEATQTGVAKAYALAIRDEPSVPVDWKRVNEAITARWPKGLKRVKGLAWDFIEGRRPFFSAGEAPQARGRARPR